MTSQSIFDEMGGNGGSTREAYRVLESWLNAAPTQLLEHRRDEAELLFRKVGITFAVYGNAEAEERLIPFDIIPRIMSGSEWAHLSRGLEQRARALNLFLKDIYGAREILRANIIPPELIFQNPHYRPQMNGLAVSGGIYVQVAGIDVVRVDDKDFYVLEDNLRTPSGVSYMLENREVMLRVFPDLMAMQRIRPIENYVDELLGTLKSVAPERSPSDPAVVLLTPGLLQQRLLRAQFSRRSHGRRACGGTRPRGARRDRLYANDRRTQTRRRDLPPARRRLSRSDCLPSRFSCSASRDLIDAYRAGNVTLANALGTGVADDKAIYRSSRT